MNEGEHAIPGTQGAPLPPAAPTMSGPKILQAIHAISAELAKTGIGKDSYNQEQKFKFRGIDAVMNKLAPLLVQYKVIIVPRFFDRILTERATKSGSIMFNICVRGEFHFVSVEDGTEVVAHTIGEGQDMADKATNKAMAVSYKYAVFQTFCIPLDAADDPDAGSNEETHREKDPTEGTLEDLTAEFDLRSLEVANLKELADIFSAAQANMKAEAVKRKVPKAALVDALGKIGKAKDTAKARIQTKPKAKPADTEGGPRGDEPAGSQEAGT